MTTPPPSLSSYAPFTGAQQRLMDARQACDRAHKQLMEATREERLAFNDVVNAWLEYDAIRRDDKRGAR